LNDIDESFNTVEEALARAASQHYYIDTPDLYQIVDRDTWEVVAEGRIANIIKGEPNE